MLAPTRGPRARASRTSRRGASRDRPERARGAADRRGGRDRRGLRRAPDVRAARRSSRTICASRPAASACWRWPSDLVPDHRRGRELWRAAWAWRGRASTCSSTARACTSRLRSRAGLEDWDACLAADARHQPDRAGRALPRGHPRLARAGRRHHRQLREPGRVPRRRRRVPGLRGLQGRRRGDDEDDRAAPGREGITAFALAPGFVNTSFNQAFFDEHGVEAAARDDPAGRDGGARGHRLHRRLPRLRSGAPCHGRDDRPQRRELRALSPPGSRREPSAALRAMSARP